MNFVTEMLFMINQMDMEYVLQDFQSVVLTEPYILVTFLLLELVLVKLVFFKLVNNLPLIVKNDAGTVDYVHGEINLDVVNISGSSLTSGLIEVEAIPDSNDVIALKDLYLQLDVTNSTVDALPDVISSGENTSATSYVTTSSYASESIYTR